MSANTGKEEHNNDRVDDREPVNLHVTHRQVRVPPRRPAHVALEPEHFVRELERQFLYCIQNLLIFLEKLIVEKTTETKQDQSKIRFCWHIINL